MLKLIAIGIPRARVFCRKFQIRMVIQNAMEAADAFNLAGVTLPMT
jgi:hypothetical protein